jgi:hypothetical protein
MAKKENALQPVEETTDLALPSFMTGIKPEGYEDVQERTQITSYRISQGLSNVVSEGIMGVGKIYDSQDKVDLGTERSIMIFKKRKVRQMMNPKGVSVACKGYGLDANNHGNGRIRLYNAKDIPEKTLEAWGITEAMLEDKDNQVVDFPCAKCPFADWKTVKKGKEEKRIPPACNLVHEIFFFDVTEGLDVIPHVFSIPLTNPMIRDVVKGLDNILNQKLRLKRTAESPHGLPIYGGILKLKVGRTENAEGQKFFIPNFEFERYLTEDDEPQFLMSRQFLRDFNKREAQYGVHDNEEFEANAPSPMEEQTGNPWANEEDSNETPWN